MSINYLHLDGLYHFTARIAEYGYIYDPSNKKQALEPIASCASTIKREFWCRITIVVQATLIMLNITVKQGLRAITFMISGILTFDSYRLKVGLTDLMSVGVQALALPILGLLAVCHPTLAGNIAHKISRRLNPNWDSPQSVQIFSGGAIKIVEWGALPFQAGISSLTTFFQEVLSLNPLSAAKQLGYTILSPFILFSCLPIGDLSPFRGYTLKSNPAEIS